MRLSTLSALILVVSAAGAMGSAAPSETANAVHPSNDGPYRKQVLVEAVDHPIELAVAPDGRVFFVERAGALQVWDPETDAAARVDSIPTVTVHNDGMLGLALDPAFETNRWMYLYYSAAEDTANVLARYTLTEDGLADRREMLRIPTQREECCHMGGSLAFGPAGRLFVATGDNTNPFESSGYAPIDERAGRAPFDAQRTSANTDDLRGKILRIAPREDGTYAIPEGNLFPDGEEGRPEIYVMGTRNPYRIAVDQKTGALYWGDVGPDADSSNAARGPAGYDELNRAREAGNYGWPYFIAENRAYRDYDFETKEAGPHYDPESPRNTSPNSTGAEELPPAEPALLWYSDAPSERHPELGSGGRTAMAGPLYRHDAKTAAENGIPASLDGRLIFYDWTRSRFWTIAFAEDGRISAIEPFLEELSFDRPIDAEIGPRGRLYVAEWGKAYQGDEHAQIARIVHEPGTVENQPRDPHEIPDAYALTAYPNPFNPGTVIRYDLPSPGRVRLAIFDLQGRLVRNLDDRIREAGTHSIRFAAENLPSGGYIARLRAGDRILTRKITLVR